MQNSIIVTGAAQGIGAAVVIQLLKEGYSVIGLDQHPDVEQWQVNKMITDQYKENWHAFAQDITAFQDTEKLIDQVLKEYHVVALVNVAGILTMTSLFDATLKQWQDSLQVNLLAPIMLSQQVARHFYANKQGSIVTVSSNSARMPRTQLGLYATTKAALSHFCRNLALEVAPYVRVNIVSPGSTLTQMQKQLWSDDRPPLAVLEGDLAQFRTGIPLKKLAEPSDIANTISFLLSANAAQITMQEIVVDGGATLGV
ncbi:SDR family oxidoreductase [Acinetobacter gerneri]|uniref:SDR family oxidoreductase n=1 Tax=Acinetobacter gerneri TaxID=202952 RepID=UPI002936C0CC|nr:SDR family oxidoreductase [Acinetobacter gerneri]MDV2438988.1 SDR family oxidoreductase [Acinetobacter gerneri]